MNDSKPKTLLHVRSNQLEESYRQQTTTCKLELGNTTQKADLPRAKLKQNLSIIRNKLFQQNFTNENVTSTYESEVIAQLVEGMDYDWEKTEQHTLWNGLRSHKELLDVAQKSCEFVVKCWNSFCSLTLCEL